MEDLYLGFLQKPRVIVVCSGIWIVSGMTVSDSLFDAMMRSGGVGMSHGLGGHIRICQFHF